MRAKKLIRVGSWVIPAGDNAIGRVIHTNSHKLFVEYCVEYCDASLDSHVAVVSEVWIELFWQRIK